MAFNVIRKVDDEKIICTGCKGDRWVLIFSNANTFSKYVCEKCWNEHTMYTYPAQYKQQEVK